MYITPNTNVRLLKNLRLDLDYTHSISWQGKNATDMFNYYSSKTKYNLTSYSYQKHSKDAIKVAINCDLLYDCNYMMFQNSAYGNKWFYAFITDVEYVNDNTSIVYYAIDVVQTWYFETWFEPCFVEREHTRTDNIGDNIQPEPVAIGEYVVSDPQGYRSLTNLQELVTLILVADKKYAINCDKYDGVFSGCVMYAFENNSATFLKDVNDFIDKYTEEGRPEAIVAMFTAPSILVKYGAESHYVTSSDKNIRVHINDLPAISPGDTIGGARNLSNTGYVPRNNKLYTYPYNFFNVDNGEGDSLTIRYEFCEDFAPKFDCRGCISMPVNVTLNPIKYKNCGNNYYLPESLSLTNYPLCSWTTDSYQAWIAQNATPITIGAISQGASTLAMVGLHPALGAMAMAGFASQVGNTISQIYSASIKADVCKGNKASGNVNVSSKLQNFFGCRMSVNIDNAKTIDNYFTMYGYAVNQLKTPNTFNRENYTYIKTIGSQIEGNIPQKDLQKINEIHDKGITYWRNGDIIGDYGVSNKPRG